MIVLEMIIMGICVTYFMDFLAGILVSKKVIDALIEPEIVGRWFLSMFKGEFIHSDIYKTPEMKNEKLWCFLSHYLIGIVLVGLYLMLNLKVSSIHLSTWSPLLFGIATVLLPWLWLFPSIGIGFFASKSTRMPRFLKTSFVNHTNFGIGLFLWFFFVHDFFSA